MRRIGLLVATVLFASACADSDAESVSAVEVVATKAPPAGDQPAMPENARELPRDADFAQDPSFRTSMTGAAHRKHA